MSDRASEGLTKVYAARSEDELAAAYSVWSNAYDRKTAAVGYCLPFVIGSWVARHVLGGCRHSREQPPPPSGHGPLPD